MPRTLERGATSPGVAVPDPQAWRFERAGEAFALLEWEDLPLAVPAELTAAEVEVAALIPEGWSNQEIAARRGTSVRTVANQVASVYRKLGVGSRGALCARLRRRKDGR